SWLGGNYRLGGQEETSGGSSVLESRAGNLYGVVDAGSQQVFVDTRGSCQAVAGRQAANLVGNYARLEASVEGDLLQRSVDCNLGEGCTGCFVTLEGEVGECLGACLDEGNATTGDDAFFNSSLGVADCVLNAVLAFLELNFGCGTGLDDCNAAGQLGQAFLQLLAVVVGIGVLDLGADLGNTARDLLGVAGTFNDGGLVLGNNNLAGGTEEFQASVLQLEANFFRDDLATGEDGDVGELCLAAVTEARSLDGYGLEGATDLVDDQGGQGLALDVFSDDQQRLVGLHDLLQDRDEFLHVGDLGVHDQDVRVFEDRFLALSVGDEVSGDVTLVEAHAFGEFELQAEGVGLLDRDDAFLAHLVQGFGDQAADFRVTGGDGSRVADLFLGFDFLGRGEQFFDDCLNSLLDTALEGQGVGAGGNVAQAFLHQCLGENRSGGGTVASDVIRLLGNFLDQLSTDLLVRIVQLDLLGDGNTIVGDRGGAPLLFEDDVASTRAEGDLDGVGEDVQASLEAAACLFIKCNDLGHNGGSPFGTVVKKEPVRWGARDGRSFACGLCMPRAPDLTPPRCFLILLAFREPSAPGVNRAAVSSRSVGVLNQ